MEWSVAWKVILVAGALIIGIGSRFICKSCVEDSIVEEVCEEIIKHETGIDIDLSPSTPE